MSNREPFIYTEEQLMDRLKFFIGVCLALTLVGIVFVVLYSLIFVTQPLNAISPIDHKFFELIVPIATFLTGTLTGIMLAGGKPEDQEAMLAAHKQAAANAEAAAKSSTVPAAPTVSANSWSTPSMSGGFGGSMSSSSSAPMTSWTTAPVSGEISSGWGGKAAPPPVTSWPER